MNPTELPPAPVSRPDDPHTDLRQPIADLLGRVPEHWGEFSFDALSERESTALLVLVAAEMVERRCRVRLRMLNQPLVVEATFTATGEYGAVEALAPLVASVWEDWQAAYTAWRESETKDVPPFHCERREPGEWRLTASGVLARRDLAEGRASVVFDFVLRRGFFSGAPRVMPDGRIVRRGPVRGHGRLVKFNKANDAPAVVAVANWSEGAEAFAKAFASKYESVLAMGHASLDATATANGQPSGSAVAQRRNGRNLETEKRLQRYLRDRDAQYQRLVNLILKGDRAVLRRFKNEFGPTAFARHVVGETGGGDEEFKCIKTAVQHVQTYLDRIKPVLRGRPPKDLRRGRDLDTKSNDKEISAFLNKMQRQSRGA